MEKNDKYIGQLLDNRYEIIEKIGEGGMSVVYKALCHRLNRYVAVKILKEEYALDEDFLRRFHTESQAVAMLSHPNIVSVYDVSRSSEIEYIVMELIEGITLKKYMQRRGALTWKEVLHFSSQIAKALAHAHSRGIIHRDIKPHNILVLPDSSVKVADFGIARLTNLQDTLTNETLGSVHYISPEQAKGGHIDSRTDLYSLGVVMYEMLTGRLPFEGDSAVSIAIQHISSIPLSPGDINPDIPAGLEAITMHAMEPDLNKRFQNAEEICDALEAFRKNPEGNYDYSEKEILQTINPEENSEETEGANVKKINTKNVKDGVHPVSRSGEMSRDEYIKSSIRARRVSTLSGIFCVTVFIIAVFVFLWNYWLSDMFTAPETMTVPALKGARLDDILINPTYTDYYNIIPTYEPSSTVESGYITEQSPTEGRHVVKGENKVDIRVVVSSGESFIIMPQVVDSEYRQAVLNLQRLKLTVEVTQEISDEIPQGIVMSQLPEQGTELNDGDVVYLTVSAGPEIKYVIMPDLTGKSLSAAEGILESMKLTLGTVTEIDSDKPADEVIFQNVPVGTELAELSVVNLNVSNGSKAVVESPEPTTEPEQGGTTEPEQGGTSEPEQGSTSEPEQGGTTEPEQGSTSEPEQGGTSEPEQSEAEAPSTNG